MLRYVSYIVICGADIKNTDPSTSGFSLQGNVIVVVDHSEESTQPSPVAMILSANIAPHN